MRKLTQYGVGVWLFLSLPGLVLADNVQQRLEQFLQDVAAFEAEFTQNVVNDDNEVLQVSQGQVKVQRPGRFRWDYHTPYRQLILSDGEHLWTYDADLAQATVQPMEQLWDSAPILLLSESRPIERDFYVQPYGEHEGLSWIELSPRTQDSDFSRVLIGMDERYVRAMVLFDHFEQQTRIRFDEFVANPDFSHDTFHFNAPASTDIIGR